MTGRANVTLPYEAGGTEHLKMAQRRMQTKRWLAERERHLRLEDTPPLVPDSEPVSESLSACLQRASDP